MRPIRTHAPNRFSWVAGCCTAAQAAAVAAIAPVVVIAEAARVQAKAPVREAGKAEIRAAADGIKPPLVRAAVADRTSETVVQP